MMEYQNLNELIFHLPYYHTLSDSQQKNVRKLITISHTFYDQANLKKCSDYDISDGTIILESGHQPNFLPYSGIWKKAFLLHHLSKNLAEMGNTSIPIFGFADQNLSTATLLYRNHVPALTKKGKERIGLKKTEDPRTLWKLFCEIEKPPVEIWQQEIDKIDQYYRSHAEKINRDLFFPLDNSRRYLEMLWESYESAKSFSDINAFFFSKVCREIFDFDIIFFRHSDIQKERMFIPEWTKILMNRNIYCQLYNQVNQEENLELNPVTQDSVPFWYHCDCGGKLPLFVSQALTMAGTCPVCEKVYSVPCTGDYQNLEQHISMMGLNAVTRNIVFSEGWGVTLFITGSGGSLKYGKISDSLSQELNFHIPLKLAWSSNDYYLGLIHKNGIQQLMKVFHFTLKDMIQQKSKGKIFSAISDKKRSLELLALENNKNAIKTETNKYNNLINLTCNVRASFEQVSSLLDILVGIESDDILKAWKTAVNNSTIEKKSSVFILQKEAIYEDRYSCLSSEDIMNIYQSIRSTEVI
jgi:hypothetical protein